MFIDKNGSKWFKGNLHMHTTRSDGRLTPEEALTLYRENGFDFVAVTDHYVEVPESTHEGMLVMAGGEFDTGGHALEGVYHIVGIGMDRPTGLSRKNKPTRQALIDMINEAGGLAFLAHPQWSLDRPEDIKKLTGLAGIEIYNTFSGFPWNGRPYSGDLLDLLALDGYLYNYTATDDSHTYEGEQCRSYILVKAEECTTAALKDAILRGDFIATQGPWFEYEIEGDILTVHSTPVSSVTFLSDMVWVDDRVTVGEGITEARYQIKPRDNFVRFELRDADGKTAWSSPIKINH